MRAWEKKILAVLWASRMLDRAEPEKKRQDMIWISLLAAMGCGVMTVLNYRQHSSLLMLASTGLVGLALLVLLLINSRRRDCRLLQWGLPLLFVPLFTLYLVTGGNSGFAALWVLLAPGVAMFIIDIKIGFAVSFYFQVAIGLLFGPLSGLLRYEYTRMFLVRFPYMYAINFAFALFISARQLLYRSQLLQKQQEVEAVSNIDLTTGLLNRNRYNRDLEAFSPGAQRSLAVVYLDLNGLHWVNNTYGHEAGDKMLRRIADACRSCFPQGQVYRLGGDEMLVVQPNVEQGWAERRVERLCTEIAQWDYTTAYGVEWRDRALNLEEMVCRADEKMLENKRQHYRAHPEANSRVGR